MTAAHKATPPTTQTRPVNPAAGLKQAKQLLKQGRGCEARTELQTLSSGAASPKAQILLPLAQFLCDQGAGGGGRPDLDSLFQQAAAAIRRGEYSSAMYNLLAAGRQDKTHRGGQAVQVMEGLFELLGDEDPIVVAYKKQLNQLA